MAKMANYASSILRKPTAWEEGRRESRFPALPTPAFFPLSAGLPRGCITEMVGRRSSGRTATALYFLACATAAGETCAVVDLCSQFPPDSAAQAGVDLDRLVWVRCEGKMEQTLRSADLLLQAGGFGMVILDLCGAEPRTLNQVPSSCWYRFLRAVEHTPTAFLICADSAQAKSCAALHLDLASEQTVWAGTAPFSLLQELNIRVAVRERAAPQIYTLPIREVV